MKVEKFFSEKDIVDFDFVKEILERKIVRGNNETFKQKYLTIENLMEKYIIYKTIFYKSDPDINGGLLKDIYEKIWDDEILNCCVTNNKIKYYSDTMTSVQGLINRFYELVYIEDNKTKEIKISLKKFEEMNSNPSKYPIFKKYFVDDNEDSRIVLDFIKHYHTLGNYIPVPRGFNHARSGNYASHDMWDITLMKIKEYYDSKEKCDFSKMKKVVLELLHNSDDIDYTIAWLNKFESWKNFVDKNYLRKKVINGEVYDNYVNENYEIDSFFKNKHSFENPTLKTKGDYLDYFKRITQIIKNRTLIIKDVYYEKNKLN